MTQEPGNTTPGTTAGREPLASELAYDALTGGQPGTPGTPGTPVPSTTDHGATAAGTTGTTAGAQGTASATKQEAQQQVSDVAGPPRSRRPRSPAPRRRQAGNVLGEAKAQAGDLFEDLRRQLAEQSDGIATGSRSSSPPPVRNCPTWPVPAVVRVRDERRAPGR